MRKLLIAAIFVTTVVNSAITTSAQANNLRSSAADNSIPNSILIAKRDSKPKTIVQHTKLSSQLKSFQTQKFQAGKKTFIYGSNDAKSGFGKHHPKSYIGRSNSPKTETFFPRKTKPAFIFKAVRSVFNQNRHEIAKGTTPVLGTYHGKTYELGVNNKGRIHHFVPKK
jgi:hypothetical protein